MWSRPMTAQTPARDAAVAVLTARLGAVPKLLRRAAAGKPGAPDTARAIHALRVSTRRAEAAVEVFAPLVREKDARRIRKRLRTIRRAAGEARDLDVQIEILGAAARGATSRAVKAALGGLSTRTRAKRRAAHEPVQKIARRHEPADLRNEFMRVIERMAAKDADTQSPLIQIARRIAGREVQRVQAAAKADLRIIDNVHILRLRLKRLRYAMEVVGVCFGDAWRSRIQPQLVAVQRCLGEVNDAHVLLTRLSVEHGLVLRALAPLITEQKQALARAHGAFLEQWRVLGAGAFLEGVLVELGEGRPAGSAGAALAPESIPTRILNPAPARLVEPKPAGLNGTHGAHRKHPGKRRIAAIDVGTNSTRLIVAEVGGAQPDGSYRILDDEKEITRLGKGLGATGRIEAGAIEHTVVTIARMKSIAAGYGAHEIRVVGTSASREARNADALARQIKVRTGLTLEIISGEEEAMLAYRSAANAFDLAGVSGAVVDIGGGSTEIVLSAAAPRGVPGSEVRRAGLGGGIIERVYTLPLGAVRLTDKFGGPAACSAERYDEMRAHIKSLLRQIVGKPPIVPQLVIGTGGTLTTLAAMVLQRELGPNADGLFSGGVQGLEVGRADLKHLLEYLRKLPVKERTRVPGLSADRADIIIAGLAIVDGVLKRFGANRLRIHEGGIRDGILLSMVGAPASESGEARRDPMRAARRLAKACAYEAAHAKHVTGLALQIFDQLVAAKLPRSPFEFNAESRLLLEAAALLHDIGYLINYAQHHKHSYHLIVHADLPGFTTRQVQVVANVARYHRGAEPKAKHRNFGTLSESDQSLVRGLSGILRIADGLDRTHMQGVSSVDVRADRGAAFFGVHAGSEPAVDLWGAIRKAGLFKQAFGLAPHLEWQSPSPVVVARRMQGEKRLG